MQFRGDPGEWLETETGYDRGFCCEIAGLGWLGTGIPVDFGGYGMGAIEALSLFESRGRHLFASPFLAGPGG